MSKTYRIQIDMFSDTDTKVIDKRTVITADSNYRVDIALVEWVTVEVDPRATVTIADATCSECRDGNHEDCSDNGLSAAPYWCQCAARRHEVAP